MITLNENDDNSNTESIIKGIKDVFSAVGLTISNEVVHVNSYFLIFAHKDDDLVYPVKVIYNSKPCFIILAMKLNADKIPKGKRKKVAELINLLNMRFPNCCMTMIPNEGVHVKSGMFLTGRLNTRELFLNLRGLLLAANCYLAMEKDTISSNQTPASIVERFEADM